MLINIAPQSKEAAIHTERWKIVHTVELSPFEFYQFKTHLLDDYPFITEHTKDLYKDKDGVTRSMLVLCEGQDEGILVCSEGYSYARYTAHLPYARTAAIMDKYPILRDCCVQMEAFVSQYARLAIEGQKDGEFTLSFADVEADAEEKMYLQKLYGFDRALFVDMLLEHPGVIALEASHNEIYLTLAQEPVQDEALGLSLQ